jgi:hypothetical protein
MSQADLRDEEVIEMHGWTWGCGRYGWRPWGWRTWEACWPTREDRIRWLQEYQRDLERRTAEVADEIRRLQEQEGTRPGSYFV